MIAFLRRKDVAGVYPLTLRAAFCPGRAAIGRPNAATGGVKIANTSISKMSAPMAAILAAMLSAVEKK